MRPIDAETLARRMCELCNHYCPNDPCEPSDCVFVQTVKEAPTLTPQNEWVSVEERLPEEKQRVIVRCERVGTSVGWILWGNWMADIGPDAGKVTHWRPLPEPPDHRAPVGEEEET